MSLTIGLDIGGTKIAAAVVDEDGHIYDQARTETPAEDPAAIVEACARLVDELRPGRDVGAVGAACAAFVDRDRSTIRFAPNLAWRDLDMRAALNDSTGLPAVVENDANAAAWGEFLFGPARDEHSMVLLTLGTGVGGGVVLEGELLRGAFGIAGELGHVRMERGGRLCGCGSEGCLERYASGTALLQQARELVESGAREAAALSERCGGDPARLHGPEVTELAQAGDPASVRLLAELGTALGEGAATIAAVLDPPVFVVGGGVSAAGELVLEPAREAFRRHLGGRDHRPVARWALAGLGNEAGVIGAAALARDVLPTVGGDHEEDAR